MDISFKDRVAIVTGAGGGLGRAYARELARRGARVVVNDRGGARDGTGASDCAQQVADEIEGSGGIAMADRGDVAVYEDMARMAARARERWGRIDILINNAGIIRDKTFANTDPQDFEVVVRVHLFGSAFASKAVWDAMREQNYGRILMTTSSAGLGGHFGLSGYGAAKMGVVGLARTLYLEGARHNIRVNSLAPVAGTRMTEDIFPQETFDAFDVGSVVPAALYLVSEGAPANAIVGAGAGVFRGAWITMNDGVALPPADRTVEGFAAAWDRISDRTGDEPVQSGMEQSAHAMKMLRNLGR